MAPATPWEDKVWELYDGATDWSQAHDVADKHPGKLTALKNLFDREARQHNVYPLDDRLPSALIRMLRGGRAS